MNTVTTLATRRNDPTAEIIEARGDRRTVIPTPRSNTMFSGWGPRF